MKARFKGCIRTITAEFLNVTVSSICIHAIYVLNLRTIFFYWKLINFTIFSMGLPILCALLYFFLRKSLKIYTLQLFFIHYKYICNRALVPAVLSKSFPNVQGSWHVSLPGTIWFSLKGLFTWHFSLGCFHLFCQNNKNRIFFGDWFFFLCTKKF